MDHIAENWSEQGKPDDTVVILLTRYAGTIGAVRLRRRISAVIERAVGKEVQDHAAST